VGVPHIGWVSTEVHLALAQRCACWTAAQVILSGLHGYEEEQHRRHRREDDVGVHPSRGYHAPRPPAPAEAAPPHLVSTLHEWAALLDLRPADLAKPFGRLSQGQQKLALVARALIGAPPLLIMDEVCQGLDSRHRALVLSLLDAIGRAAGGWLSMLYITHHADESLSAITHVLELEKGRVTFQGTAAAYAGVAAAAAAAAGGEGGGKGEGSGSGSGHGKVDGLTK
jgi:ABC-type molybdenum transport system ATPase subunit/photorepair protein PhrA